MIAPSPGSQRPRSTTARAGRLIGLGAVGALVLAGCGADPVASRPVVVVTSATANEPAPALAAGDLEVLQAAAAGSDASATLVAPDGTVEQFELTPKRTNGRVENSRPRRAVLIEENLAAVEAAVADDAATGPVDLLELLGTAERSSQEPGTLLVLSSGVSTTGGLDLRQTRWGADPQAVAAELAERQLVPDLTGWDVVFSGLGDTAAPQPPLGEPQRRSLQGYWTAICEVAGASSCEVDDHPRTAGPTSSGVPVPVVEVPAVRSVVGPEETVTTLPADMLFTFDSAALGDEAAGVLAPLAADIAAGGLRVTVTGHASPDGGSVEYNRDLSAQRARAVEAALVDQGVPATAFDAVTGVGTDAAAGTSCSADSAACADLRRVVVTTRPASAPAA